MKVKSRARTVHYLVLYKTKFRKCAREKSYPKVSPGD
jgi:hypothetical protein